MRETTIGRGSVMLGVAFFLVTLQTVPADAARHALLVGCTRYVGLCRGDWLAGGQNDVELMRDFLVRHFDFPRENVTILAEENAKARPTRANILAEFERLSKIARSGDQVVILLAGHGSYQPVPPDNDPKKNFEPDGLDEVFLACDVEGIEANQAGKITNGIVDDEIHDWLGKILDAQASVWIIFDACHSGTMVRGNDVEVARRIAPERLVPEKLLREAEARAARQYEAPRGGSQKSPRLSRRSLADSRLVAFYAAQPTEQTPEDRLPKNNPEAKRHGLFTFALVQALGECTAPLTYQELLHRIQGLYTRWGRTGPSPSVEGGDQERFVLGVAEGVRRTPVRLRQAADGSLSVTAGQLRGLTAGTVLAVYPAPGVKDADKPVGHVRVTKMRTFDAVVEPCAFEKLPVAKTLPDGGRCEVAEFDSGVARLRLALDDRDNAGQPVDPDVVARWRNELKKVDTGATSPLAVVADPKDADWLVRIDQGAAMLVPAAGWTGGPDPGTGEFGPVPGDKAAEWLEERLRAIYRARTLLQVAATPAEQFRSKIAGAVDVQVELLRYKSENDRQGEIVPWRTGDLTLRHGDVIGVRIHNRSLAAVDVSLLFVDSGYGIAPIFPPLGRVFDNQIKSGATLTVPPMQVEATTVGKEHLVVIATASRREPLDFGFLAQRTLPVVRGRGAQSPLVALFETTMFGEGATRGLRNAELPDHAFELMSWQVRRAGQ